MLIDRIALLLPSTKEGNVKEICYFLFRCQIKTECKADKIKVLKIGAKVSTIKNILNQSFVKKPTPPFSTNIVGIK